MSAIILDCLKCGEKTTDFVFSPTSRGERIGVCYQTCWQQFIKEVYGTWDDKMLGKLNSTVAEDYMNWCGTGCIRFIV